ncbi:uncharacterized protein KY384_003737 [Bacidia gigantensis]|uniref:uncharacterized protein n=1 Tax=Bacidia gigantensis TaxID=2732470 RepID=UPI001D04320D|nr:uncharacterized protein KY384_003737 [Bacidia gigantensis]KAG8532100.1 hypothetical protein KY384_003737 [Bacidia gigantensis]
MFPGKTRHAIKRKFVKEERLDYPRIKATLLGKKVPVVLEEYEKMTGAEYEDPAELDKIMEDDRKQLEEEQAAEKAAMEEAERQREEVAAAERAAAAEDNSGHESGGKGKKRKGKKGKRKERGQDGARLRRSRKKKDIGLGGDGFLMGVEDPVSRAVTQATAQN